MAAQLYRLHRQQLTSEQLIRQLSFTLLALALLAKMVLNTRIYHYGFVLAMPATMVVLMAALDWIPELIRRLGGAKEAFIAIVLSGLLIFTGAVLQVQYRLEVGKTVRVGQGADAFWTDWRGQYLEPALAEFRHKAKPDDTLVCFPECSMANYLSRHVSSVPYTNFQPVEETLFGEENMLASLQAHPPDWILLVEKENFEFGIENNYMGSGFGKSIMQWVRGRYHENIRIGNPPLVNGKYGVWIIEKNKDIGLPK
jgi:hypothetical protein